MKIFAKQNKYYFFTPRTLSLNNWNSTTFVYNKIFSYLTNNKKHKKKNNTLNFWIFNIIVKYKKKIATSRGIEPPTPWSGLRCSAIEPRDHSDKSDLYVV